MYKYIPAYMEHMCKCTYANAVNSRSGNVYGHSKFNDEQLAVLEAAFVNNSYLQQSNLLQVTKQTGLDITQIRDWFKHRRYKIRHWKNEEGVSICEYFYFLCLSIHLIIILSVCFPALSACLTSWLAIVQACFLYLFPPAFLPA